MASKRAKRRRGEVASEKGSCITNDEAPKHSSILAQKTATPAPANLTAVLMLFEIALTTDQCDQGMSTAKLLRLPAADVSGWFNTTAESGQLRLRGAPDHGVGKEELGAGIHVQGRGAKTGELFSGQRQRRATIRALKVKCG